MDNVMKSKADFEKQADEFSIDPHKKELAKKLCFLSQLHDSIQKIKEELQRKTELNAPV